MKITIIKKINTDGSQAFDLEIESGEDTVVFPLEPKREDILTMKVNALHDALEDLTGEDVDWARTITLDAGA